MITTNTPSDYLASPASVNFAALHTPAGLHTPRELPHAPKPVAKLLAEYADLADRYRAASEVLRSLENNRTAAALDDTRAYAAAIRRGEDDPGNPNTRALDQQINETRRRRDALGVACDQTEAELRAAVTSNADQWTTDLDTAISEQNTKIAGILDQLADVLDQRARLRACRSFVDSAGTRWKFAPGTAMGVGVPDMLHKLRTELLDEQ